MRRRFRKLAFALGIAALLIVWQRLGCRTWTPPTSISSSGQRVVRIIDGDTLELLRDGRPVRVRLEGIDAPERSQPFSDRARQALSELTFGREVRTLRLGQDRYGRELATVFVGSEDINGRLVRDGMAWAFVRYSTAYVGDESLARAARRGLWSEPNPIPPWEWRSGRRP